MTLSNYKTKFFGVAALTALLTIGSVAFAQGTEAQTLVIQLRTQHVALKAQVDAGEITAEEARATWVELVQEARVKKEEHYANRLQKAEDRIARIAEKNPERAEEIRAFLSEVKEHRKEQHAQRKDIAERVKSGEITREEARALISDVKKEQKEYRDTVKMERKDRRTEMKDERMEKKDERMDERMENHEGMKEERGDRMEKRDDQVQKRQEVMDDRIQKIEVRKENIQFEGRAVRVEQEASVNIDAQ